MSEKNVKEKDINAIVHHLSSVFNNNLSKLPRAFRSRSGEANEAYILETEFAYLLNELMQGPRALQQKNIAEINNFIDRVVSDLNSRQDNPST